MTLKVRIIFSLHIMLIIIIVILIIIIIIMTTANLLVKEHIVNNTIKIAIILRSTFIT